MPERVSEAELVIMELLWEKSPLTAADVVERAAPARGWSASTVKTMLARLTDKGWVSHEQEGRRYLYRPEVSRTEYVGGESGRFVDRLFGGKAAPLIAHLAERNRLGDEDIAEIENLLKELKS